MHTNETAGILNEYHQISSSSYLELGVGNNQNFEYIKTANKYSVDTMGLGLFRGTTDEYFQQLEPNAKFDFIFIDGDHSYPGVKKDYESVLPYVSENGVMVFHDAWWDVHPYPVKGPMMLLEELGGYIINKTHLGILKSDVHKII